MYQSATLMDVFRNAAAAASPLLQHETAKLKEQNDLQLRNDAARFATDAQIWLQENPYDGDFARYLGRLQGYADEWHGKEAAGNSSPYYRKNIEAMRQQSIEMLRAHAAAEDGKWRAAKEDADCAEDIKRYMGAGWDPHRTMRAIYNRVDLSKTIRPIDPEQESQMLRSIEKAYYQQYAAARMGEARDVRVLDKIMADVHEAFLPAMAASEGIAYDEWGNESGREARQWTYDGREEWEQALAEREAKRIQGEHFERFREAQSYMERQAVSGDIAGAIATAKRFGPQWNRYYNPNNPEFANSNEAFRDRGSHYFDAGKLEGYLAQGTKGEQAAKIDVNPGRFVAAAMPGGGGIVDLGAETEPGQRYMPVGTLKEAWEKFISLKETAYRAAHGNGVLADINWANEREEWFGKFLSEMRTQMRNRHPNLESSYVKLMNYDTYKKDEKSPFFIRQERSDKDGAIREKYIQNAVDFVTDLFWSGATDPVELEKRVKDFIAADISRNLQWKSTPDNEGDRYIKLKAFSDEVTAGKANDEVRSKSRIESLGIFSDEQEDSLIWRRPAVKNYAEGVRIEEQKIIADALGIPAGRLNAKWMLSNDKERDPIPKGQFAVESGEKKGTYCLGWDENANGIVFKYNNKNKEWESTGIAVERRRTAAEQHAAEKDFDKNRYKYSDMIREGLNPLTGEKADFNYLTEPPPGASDYYRNNWNRMPTGRGSRASSAATVIPETDKRREWLEYFRKQVEQGR